jgi:hypothetical protein
VSEIRRRDLPPNAVSGLHIDSVDAGTLLISSRVRSIHDWWHGLAAQSGGVPRWDDFDIVEHRALAPYLFVVETPSDGAFRFRLLGETVINMIGRNVSGELVASRPRDDYGHDLYGYYQSIILTRACRMCRGTLDFTGSEHRHFESIDCPTADDQGEITRIIGVMDYIEAISA